MKKILLFTMALSASMNALAQGANDPSVERTLTEVPQDTVQAAIEQCKSWAKEDGVPEADLDGYLLNCVNQELEAQDYLPVEALD